MEGHCGDEDRGCTDDRFCSCDCNDCLEYVSEALEEGDGDDML